jgi:hypothetical protein
MWASPKVGFSYDTQFLDEQFNLVLGMGTTAIVLGMTVRVVLSAAFVYHYDHYDLWEWSRMAISPFLFMMFIAARIKMVSTRFARMVAHTMLTFVPIAYAIHTLCIIEPNQSRVVTALVSGRLRLLAVVPVLIGILMRLPFWTHLLWSRLLILVITTLCWHRMLPTEQLRTDAMTQAFVSVISIFLAHTVERAHLENYSHRHAKGSTI